MFTGAVEMRVLTRIRTPAARLLRVLRMILPRRLAVSDIDGANEGTSFSLIESTW